MKKARTGLFIGPTAQGIPSHSNLISILQKNELNEFYLSTAPTTIGMVETFADTTLEVFSADTALATAEGANSLFVRSVFSSTKGGILCI